MVSFDEHRHINPYDNVRNTSQMPGDLRYREYTLVSFFRQFELGEQMDQAGMRAELKQGVLTLTLPKAAKAQPRAITVNAA